MKRLIKSSWDIMSPPREIETFDLDIVDCWDDNGDAYFTVDIGDDYLVDVKYPRLLEKYRSLSSDIPFGENYSYIMNCDETGSEIYNRDMFGSFRELTPPEIEEIIEFVDDNAQRYLAETLSGAHWR